MDPHIKRKWTLNGSLRDDLFIILVPKRVISATRDF